MNRHLLIATTTTLLLLGGCHRRTARSTALPAAPPEIRPVMVSVPPPTHPTEPLTEPAVAPIPPPQTVAPPKKPRRKKIVPVPVVVSPPVIAATAPPPIELGQLSAGGDAGNNLRGETEAMLTTQKQRIDRLPASVSTAHPTEIEQAKRFLKGAEDAWKIGDIEGAHTLVVKAKVLLDDLSK